MAKRETNGHKLDTIVDKVSEIATKLEVHITKFESHVEHENEQNAELRQNTEVLRVNTESLQDHMARTDALENYVKKIDERFTPVELESIRRAAVSEWWKNKLVFVAKLGGAVGAIGALGGALKFLLDHA